MTTARDIMHADVTCVGEHETLAAAAQVRRLPVVEDHRLVGIVTEADIARHLPEHAIVEFIRAICLPKSLASH